jgi:zinc transporter, ZIP family
LLLAIGLAAAAVVPRLIGGLSVLRRHDRLHLAMGFAGGAMIGVALFETMPEAFELAPGGGAWVAVTIALGVLVFAALERRVFQHVHVEDTVCNPRAAEIGAGGITTHAFLDGLAIGAAFQASSELGLLVSSAVLLHAFADGLNTVTILLRHGHRHRKAIAWLAADAAAPILGASLGLLIPLPDPLFAAILAFFAGMFLYFGAGSLLPQAHRSGRNRILVTSASVAGIALAYGAASLA